MENHPRPHQQTTPDPLAEPVAIFVEGMDFTPPTSEQPSSELSADSENTPTDQQQTTPFSGESGLEHSSRVFPMQARSPNPFDHPSNYQPGQSNYQRGAALGLTQLMGPNFGAFGSAAAITAEAPAPQSAPMAHNELNHDSASVMTSSSTSSSGRSSRRSTRSYKRLQLEMDRVQALNEKLQVKASADTEVLIQQLLEQNSNLERLRLEDSERRHQERAADKRDSTATGKALSQLEARMKALSDVQALSTATSHAPNPRAKPISPVIPGGTVDNAGIRKRRESMGFDASTASYEAAGLRPKSHVTEAANHAQLQLQRTVTMVEFSYVAERWSPFQLWKLSKEEALFSTKHNAAPPHPFNNISSKPTSEYAEGAQGLMLQNTQLKMSLYNDRRSAPHKTSMLRPPDKPTLATASTAEFNLYADISFIPADRTEFERTMAQVVKEASADVCASYDNYPAYCASWSSLLECLYDIFIMLCTYSGPNEIMLAKPSVDRGHKGFSQVLMNNIRPADKQYFHLLMNQWDAANAAAGVDEKAPMTGMSQILGIITGLTAANDKLLVVVHAPSQPLFRALSAAAAVAPPPRRAIAPSADIEAPLIPPVAYRGRFSRPQSVTALAENAPGEDLLSSLEHLEHDLSAVDYQLRGAGNLANTGTRMSIKVCGKEAMFGVQCQGERGNCQFGHDPVSMLKLAFDVSRNCEQFLNARGLSASTGDHANQPTVDTRPAHLRQNTDKPMVQPHWDMKASGTQLQHPQPAATHNSVAQAHSGTYQSPPNPIRSLHSLDSNPARVHFQEFSASSYDPFLANERRSLQYCPEEQDDDA
jgi:hypothetical protein